MERLYPRQIPHFEKIAAIFQYSIFAGDGSLQGLGKTWIGCALAKEFGLKLFIIAPEQAQAYWDKVAKIFGVKIVAMYAYGKIRSTKGHQPKHGYLVRYDYEDKSKGFAVTDNFIKLVNEGILMICDECQMIKNPVAQTLAIRALVNALDGTSRLLVTSGTPFEEAKHIINLFKLVGFLNPEGSLFTTTRLKQFVPLGIAGLVKKLKEQHPEDMAKIEQKFNYLSKDTFDDYILSIFEQVIYPNYFSSMSVKSLDKSDNEFMLQRDVRESYYKFEQIEDEQNYIMAMKVFEAESHYDREEDQVDFSQIDHFNLKIKHMDVETAEIPLFVKRANNILKQNSTNKVLIFVNFTNTINQLNSQLAAYEPLVLDGRVKGKRRIAEIVDAFQMDPTRRLILLNIRKGGISLNLHDTEGNAERYSLISASFSLTDIHQATGRTSRCGSKSIAHIELINGEITLDPTMTYIKSRILRSLSEKAKDVKRILPTQRDDGILFPGEYPVYREE